MAAGIAERVRENPSAYVLELQEGNGLESVGVELFRVLHQEEMEQRSVSVVSDYVQEHVGDVSAETAVAMIDTMLQALKSPSYQGWTLGTLPFLLRRIQSEAQLSLDVFRMDPMTGQDFVQHLVDLLSKTRLYPKACLPFVICLKEEPFASSCKLHDLVHKVSGTMKEIGASQLPGFIYHLILVVVKQPEAAEATFAVILEQVQAMDQLVAEKQDRAVVQDLIQNEATAINHIAVLAQQNPVLCKSIQKTVRRFYHQLTPFAFGVVLSLHKGRNQESVFKFLLSYITKSLLYHKTRAERSQFQVCSQFELYPDMYTVTQTLVSYSRIGWDALVPSLIEFLFTLMDKSLKKGHVVLYAATFLRKVFSIHSYTQVEILEQCSLRIMTAVDPSVYFGLLKQLPLHSLSRPSAFTQRVYDAIETCVHNQGSAALAIQWLGVMVPLIPYNQQQADAFAILLRKSAFQPEAVTRTFAARGLFAIASTSVQQEQSFSSQCSSQSTQRSTHMLHEESFFQITGLVQRGLQQQKEVRVAIYGGLMDLYHRSEGLERVQSYILQILYSQFSKYYDSCKSSALPFYFENHSLANADEDLGYLCHTLHSMLLHHDGDSLYTEFSTVHDAMLDCMERFVACTLENFTFTQCSEYSQSVEGESKDSHIRTNITNLCVSSLSVLVEFTDFALRRDCARSGDCVEAVKLHRLYLAMEEATKHLLNRLGPKVRSSVQSSITVLSFDTCLAFLQRCQDDEETLKSQFGEHWSNMHVFVHRSAAQHIATSVEAYDTNMSPRSMARLTEQATTLFPLLAHQLRRNIDGDFLHRDVVKALVQLLSTLISLSSKADAQFVPRLFSKPESNAAVHELVMEWVDDAYSLVDKVVSSKTMDLLPCGILLLQALYRIPEQSDAVLERMKEAWWTLSKTEALNILRSQAVPILELGLCFDRETSAMEGDVTLDILDTVANDALLLLGDVENEIIPQPGTTLRFLNDNNCADLLLVSCDALQQLFVDLSSCTAEAKLIQNMRERSETKAGLVIADRHAMEEEITMLLFKGASVLATMVRAQVNHTAAVKLVETATACFKCLGNLTSTLSSSKTYPTVQYQKLVELVNMDISPSLYRLLEVIQGPNRDTGSESKSNVLKESRRIPQLIFMIESSDKKILQYASSTKSNLQQYIRRGAARDFRIVKARVLADTQKKDKKRKRSKSSNSDSVSDGGQSSGETTVVET